jgi:hypothetical protein
MDLLAQILLNYKMERTIYTFSSIKPMRRTSEKGDINGIERVKHDY